METTQLDFKSHVAMARTCRIFKEQERIDLGLLTWLIDCARLSPCGRNAQLLRFSIAHTEQSCAAVFPHLKWAGALKDWGGPQDGQRPTAYVAILTPKKCTKIQHIDAGIAAQSIQLGAGYRELGCCMHASFNAPECDKIFETPEDMNICLILALGVADEKRIIAPMPSSGEFDYWRENNVHFVPKRSLEDLILKVF